MHLIASQDKIKERVLNIEGVMREKLAHDKFLELFLVSLMILCRFLKRRKPAQMQAIWQDNINLFAQQYFCLLGRRLTYCRKDMRIYCTGFLCCVLFLDVRFVC